MWTGIILVLMMFGIGLFALITWQYVNRACPLCGPFVWLTIKASGKPGRVHRIIESDKQGIRQCEHGYLQRTRTLQVFTDEN